MRVVLDADGAGEVEPPYALHVSEAVLAPLYAPEVTWRFGVGARSGTAAPAAHQLDRLGLGLGLGVGAGLASPTYPYPYP